jgi:hypothetical protein
MKKPHSPIDLQAARQQRIANYSKPYPSAGWGILLFEGAIVGELIKKAEAENFTPVSYVAHVLRTGLNISSRLAEADGVFIKIYGDEVPSASSIFIRVDDTQYAGKELITAVDLEAKAKGTNGPAVVHDYLAIAAGLIAPDAQQAEVLAFKPRG